MVNKRLTVNKNYFFKCNFIDILVVVENPK